jgi:hypothetical protein
MPSVRLLHTYLFNCYGFYSLVPQVKAISRSCGSRKCSACRISLVLVDKDGANCTDHKQTKHMFRDLNPGGKLELKSVHSSGRLALCYGHKTATPTRFVQVTYSNDTNTQ